MIAYPEVEILQFLRMRKIGQTRGQMPSESERLCKDRGVSLMLMPSVMVQCRQCCQPDTWKNYDVDSLARL